MVETTGETRRSTRIAAQPKKEEPKQVKLAKKPSKKRTAEAADADGDVAESSKVATEAPANKKTKGEDGSAGDGNSSPTLDPIEIGETLPSFVLKNEKDEDVDVATLAREKGVVFFLVPKADTPGCTTQACGFRDIYPDFASLGYEVYCLSADTPVAQTKWQSKKQLPYPLLSDRNRVLITALGAGQGGKTKRSHFIFEKGGKLVDKRIPVKPVDSPKLALEFIRGHATE